jgi:3'-phosphoadenosine 5'-phosphosulfate sulfotransferase (PAPS reductase)/FAD synthetase
MNASPMALAYKGGKESDIILYQSLYLDPIIFHIDDAHEFPEIKEHMKAIEIIYDIKIILFSTLHEAITFLKTKRVGTIIMGNKKTDMGWADKAIYTKMLPKYPKMTSYNPLFEWTYKQVWDYIDREKLLTCSLYNKGYTSIATTLNTFPNYFLYTENKGYNHAKYLEGDLERQGIIMDNLPVILTCHIHNHKLTEKVDILDGIYYGTINNNLILIKIKKKVVKIQHKNEKNVTVYIKGFNHRGNKITHKDTHILEHLLK